MADTYKCAICRGIFSKAISDDEAAEALKDEFPGFDVEQCDVVCDDCYQQHFGNIQ